MNISITGLSQEFDLQTKEQVNFAIFRMPNGKTFRAKIEEETVKDILSLNFSPAGVSAVQDAPALPSSSLAPEYEDETHVFGGEQLAPVQEPAPPPPPEVKSMKPIFAGRDEAGYPKLIYPNGIDPSTVTGIPDGAGDEDGIGQL